LDTSANPSRYASADAGRVIGAAAIARSHADPMFRSDMERAKGELGTVRTAKLPPQGDCRIEEQ
jgi:acid phosphatase (class A)